MKTKWFSLLWLLALCGAGLGLSVSEEACADSWAMPDTETTLSANGHYRFTVQPADIGSQLDYFRNEVEAERSGEQIKRPAPIGLLERRNADGGWEPVWAVALVNTVAPVEVLISDNGRHVVTFDNWHSIGHGEHVIVIYGPDGTLIRSMALTDLVPQAYMDALPRSVSSVQWRGSGSLSADAASLTVNVLIPGQERSKENPETIGFIITLADGAIQRPPAEQWDKAQCAADRVNAEQQQAEAERVAYLTGPLVVPQGCEMRDWHEYLREAHVRLSDEPAFDASTSTTVLFPRDNSRHRESVKWLKDRMLEDWDANDVSVASPCDPDGLVAAVRGITKPVRPGKMANLTLYVAAPEAQFAQIVQVLAPTGAKTVWLDPAAAIPQRPDRIPGSPEQKAAEAAWSDSMLEEIGMD